MVESYRDRTGDDPQKGAAIRVSTVAGEIMLELGTLRRVGVISADAWAALSPAEARELIDDLAKAVSRLGAPVADRPSFRTGDHILHKPSGETWVCAWADPETGYLSWLGWPPGEAKISDFELAKAATEEEHRAQLRDLKRSTRRDAAKALRLYGDPDEGEASP